MSNSKSILPYVALGSGILALGFSAIFVRWASAPGPVMAFFRLSLATVFLTPLFYRRLRASGRLSRGVLIFPILGGVFTALDHAVWNTSLLYAPAANATLLNNTAPLWVALCAWLLFRERLKGTFWAGLGLTLTGAVAVLGSDFLRHPSLGWGDLLALTSGFFYGCYFLITQRGRQNLETLMYVWIVTLTSSLLLLGTNLVMGLPLSGYSTQTYLAFFGAALISQVGGYLSVAYALGHLPASVVSPTMLGQPVVTALLAFLFLNESLNPVQIFGGLVVLAGIYLVHRSREAHPAAVEILPAGLEVAD